MLMRWKGRERGGCLYPRVVQKYSKRKLTNVCYLGVCGLTAEVGVPVALGIVAGIGPPSYLDVEHSSCNDDRYKE